MTGPQLRLDIATIRDRRISLNLPTRILAGELGIAEAGYRRFEGGDTDGHLTITQLGRLAATLELDARTLLLTEPTTGHRTQTDLPPDEAGAKARAELVRLLGPMLLIIGRAVPVATLADLVGADSAAVQAALEQLRDQLAPGGLVVSLSKPGATLVPGHTKQGAAVTRQLLRQAERRAALNTPSARLMHRLSRGDTLAQVPKQAERQQLSILVQAGWLQAPPGRSGVPNRLVLHPDVAYSLVLEDGEPTEQASASVWTEPSNRAKFTWLDAEPDQQEG